MSLRHHVILADNIDDTQRFLIHESVKEVSAEWWHNFPNVWIVQSELTATEWRNRLMVFTPAAPSAIVAIGLSDTPGVAYRGPGSSLKWLIEHFSNGAKKAEIEKSG